MKNKIKTTLLNNPLVLTKPDAHLVAKFKNCSNHSIFFGVGIMTETKLSTAVPFDILSFFLTAEQIRRLVRGKKIIVLVADQHAITNQLAKTSDINQVCRQTIKIIKQIKTAFNLKHLKIIRTINLNQVQEIKDIFASLPPIDNGYLKHEIADALWLKQHHQAAIKLGWAMNTNPNHQGHDERFFDNQIKKFCTGLSFIHLKPGRTFAANRPRVSPYICTNSHQRIIISKQEDVTFKFKQAKQELPQPKFKATCNHLNKIIRLHQGLFPNSNLAQQLQNRTVPDKIQLVINYIVNSQPNQQ